MRRPSLSNLRGSSWVLGKSNNPIQKTESARSREWFAVTAFPLIAGTFGPVASALNLCSLVQPWKMTPELDGDDFPDPKWLIGINAISLLFGLAANISLFLVVSNRRGFLTKNRPIFILVTILGGMIASFLLVALVVSVSLKPWKPTDLSISDYRFTEAFFYAIMSAALYFITSGFVVYTAYMLRSGSRPRQEEENVVQLANGYHRLMVLTVLFMAYILAGAAVFSHIEGWRYLDAVYWADVTILTVGFGDFSPHTHLARCLLFPYAVGGIIIVLLIVFCIPKLVLDRGKSMWEINLRDRERIKKVHQRDKQQFLDNERNKVSKYAHLWRDKAVKGHENALQHKRAVETINTLMSQSKLVQQHEEREARRQDFNHMQDTLVTAARKRLGYSISIWGSSLLLLWLAGAAIFSVSERSQAWSYFEGVYFTFVALLAIGYGDFTLQSPSGKSFFFLWSLIAVPTMTMLVSAIVDAAGNPYLVRKDWTRYWMRKAGLGRKETQKHKAMTSDNGEKMFQELPHNVHDKNHLLAETIKRVLQDHLNHQRNGERPHYDFEYWERILYLMDAFEPAVVKSNVSSARAKESGPSAEESRNTQSIATRSSMEEWKNKTGMTDWLHGKNPLNATETLTGWLLVTLVDKLELELLDLRKQTGAVTEGL